MLIAAGVMVAVGYLSNILGLWAFFRPKTDPDLIIPPAAARRIEDRRKSFKVETFKIDTDADFDRPIQFLEQYTEKTDRLLLSPVTFGIEYFERGTGKRNMVTHSSPVDIIEELHKYRTLHLLPLEVTIFDEPTAVREKDGRPAFFLSRQTLEKVPNPPQEAPTASNQTGRAVR